MTPRTQSAPSPPWGEGAHRANIERVDHYEGWYKTDAQAAAAAALVKKVGAEHLIVSTDCGQTSNVYPTDCLALAARRLRDHGVTQRELDLMYKTNPAQLLGLPLL